MTGSIQTRKYISIHALRGEGDVAFVNSFLKYFYFNPRPPWGGRPSEQTLYLLQHHFNPRPPWGGRRLQSFKIFIASIFQSTPSVGRATRFRCQCSSGGRYFNPRPPWGGRQLLRLRRDIGRYFNPRPPWGGRHYLLRIFLPPHHFNPRPPWGGRQLVKHLFPQTTTFQSTPSVGRATAKIYKYAMLCLYIVHIKLYIFATAVLFT